MRQHSRWSPVLLALLAVVGPAALTVPSAAAAGAAGATYHVSPDGDDAASGRSPAQAWRTLARAGAADLDPGDRLLLEGGRTFAGTLVLGPEDAGEDPAVRTVVGSYGQGRARIAAGAGRGVWVRDAGAVTVQDLDVVGAGRTANATDGVAVTTERPGDVLLRGVTVQRVRVSGFGEWGVVVGSWAGRTGYADVLVDRVEAHGNGQGGILTYAEEPYVHRGVHVRRSSAHDNPGVPGRARNTGNGIVLGDVDGGGIADSEAHGNGALNSASEGPVGIWAYRSNAVVIERNTSHHNRTGSSADGGGFDLDIDTTGSVLQHNVSYANDGAGYLVYSYPPYTEHRGNVVRYNLSVDDGRRNGYGGIHVGGTVRELSVHSNTVVMGPARSGTPSALRVDAAGSVVARNNLLVTRGGVPLVQGGGALLQGNAYWSGRDPFVVRWDGAEHRSLAAWRAATGQERLDGVDVGLHVDPQLRPRLWAATRTGVRVGPATHRLLPGSPLVDAGLDLRALGTDPGRRDLDGTPVPVGRGLDVGADEAGPAPGR